MTDTASSSPIQRTWRQLRALVLTALALLIIVTALLVGIGRALSPHADRLRPWLERAASERLGQAVSLQRIEAEWPRLTPSLSLIGVKLEDGAGNQLSVDRARLEVHLPNALDRRLNVVRLVLLGLEMVLEPDAEGRWGAQLGGGGGGDWTQQLPPGDLLIRDALVRVRPLQWPEIVLHLDEGSLQRQGERTDFQGSLTRPGSDETLDLKLQIEHPDQDWRAARGWLGVQGLSASAFAATLEETDGQRVQPEARLDAQVWLDWERTQNRVALDLELSGRAAPGGDTLQALARLEAVDKGVTMEVGALTHGDVRIGTGLALGRRAAGEQVHWALAVDELDLALLHQALAPWLDEQAYWPLELAGQIQELVIGLDEAFSLHAASGRLQDLNLQMAEPLPGIAGLTLDLGLEGDRLVLNPSGQTTARWRRHIRADMELDDIAGQLLLAPASIELRGLTVDSTVAQATADGWIYLQRPRPFLDFLIDVRRVGPVDPRPYLSYRTIPEPAMNWLDQALLWVEQASGLVNLHLTAGTRARDLRPGSYQAELEFRGVQLDYWADWPRAEAVDGTVAFVGNSLSGSIERARFGTVELAASALEIPELTAPTMTVDLEADAVEADDLLAVLAAIPVDGWQAVLAPLQWRGELDARARLSLPFRTMSDWGIAGRADFSAAEVAFRQPALGFDALSGSLVFDRAGIEPTVLEARLANQVFDLALAAGFEAPTFLDLAASFNPAGLEWVSQALGPLADELHGASAWGFRVAGIPADAGGGIEMRLESDLAGLALGWPTPLDKRAEESWPSQVSLALRPNRQELDFRLADRLAGHWVWADAIWSLGLAAGPAAIPESPAEGARIRGQLERLAVRDWLPYLGSLSVGDPGSALRSLDLELQIDLLQLPGLSASQVELELVRDPDGWSARIESPEVAGNLSVPLPLDLGRAAVADLERLHLERAAPADPSLRYESGDQPDATSAFSPRGLPSVSLAVEDLRWGDLVLGRARVEAHPMDRGLEFELFDVSGVDLRLQGRGRWIDTETGPASQFRGRMTSPSLGALVRAAGYEAGLEAARAQVDLDVSWPGAPHDFALRRLLGLLDLQLNDGEIPEARPGAGRLLGLASFNAIPRRLMLDFRDVFSAGLRFDDVEGSFALEGGYAVTDGLVLRSPAAVITISGQTDMAARRYDQQIIVEPGLGATLPVIGGLAGGPVGAAAGLVLRQLLERPLRGLAEVRYQVSGPWDAPEIELVAARLPDEPATNDAPGTPLPR